MTETFPSRSFGRYRLLARLASGGTADVYLARMTAIAEFNKLVALKILHPERAGNREFIDMLLDEARIASRINHRNVVQIIDLDCIAGRHYIAMEYVSGENLATIQEACSRRGKRIPPHLVAAMLLQVAEGLYQAHSAHDADGNPLRIVHRDVTPQNIIVGNGGLVKLADFGIARAENRVTETRTGMVKGKVACLSPEQVRGEILDARSDLFSLGAVMWECLTGRRLHDSASDLEIMEAITSRDAPSPLIVDPHLPVQLCEIALRALARDREERFSSAAELRDALQDYLRASRVRADPPAIDEFMQELFGDWTARTKFISAALQTTEDLAEEPLPTIEELLHRHRNSRAGDKSPPAPAPRRRSRHLAVALFLLSAGVFIFWLLTAGGQPPAISHRPADAPVPPQAGRVVPPGDRRGKKASRRRASTRRRRRSTVKPGRGTAKENTPRPALTGRLRLTTMPWSTIFYRDRELGQTPLVDVELPAGIVRLHAVNREAGIDGEIIVKIVPGQVVTMHYSFH